MIDLLELIRAVRTAPSEQEAVVLVQTALAARLVDMAGYEYVPFDRWMDDELAWLLSETPPHLNIANMLSGEIAEGLERYSKILFRPEDLQADLIKALENVKSSFDEVPVDDCDDCSDQPCESCLTYYHQMVFNAERAIKEVEKAQITLRYLADFEGSFRALLTVDNQDPIEIVAE